MGETKPPVGISPPPSPLQKQIIPAGPEGIRFGASEAYIKDVAHRFTLVLMVWLPSVCLLDLYFEPETLEYGVMPIVAVIMLLEALPIIFDYWGPKNLRKCFIVLTEDTVTRIYGKASETLPYSQIRLVKASKNLAGKIILLNIYSETTRMELYAFDRMNEMFETIKSRSPNAPVKEKSSRFGVLFNVCLLLIIFPFLLSTQLLGHDAEFLTTMLFGLAFGAWIVLRRPMSAMNVFPYKRLEKFLGVLLIALPILGIIVLARHTVLHDVFHYIKQFFFLVDH